MQDLTKKQQAPVDHLREHGPTTVRDLAVVLGSTGRGIGVMWSVEDISRGSFSEEGGRTARSARSTRKPPGSSRS